VGLSDEVVKCLGSIFAGENLVTHAINLNALIDARKHKIEPAAIAQRFSAGQSMKLTSSAP
jgi:hypothetical protein